MLCGKCGERNPKGAEYCLGCGRRFKQVEVKARRVAKKKVKAQRTKKKRASIKKKSGLRRFLIAAVCLFMVFAAIGAVSAIRQDKAYGTVNHEDLDRYARQGQAESLLGFINYGENRDNMKDLVEKAVALIINDNMEEGLKGLEDMFYRKDEDGYISLTIVRAFNEKSLQFNDMDSACEYYVSYKRQDEVRDEFAAMLRGYDRALVEEYFRDRMVEAYMSDDSKKALEYADSLKRLIPDSHMDVSKLKSSLENLETLKNDLETLEEELAVIGSEMDSLKKDIPGREVLNLHAYMIQEIGKDEYEIAFAENSHKGEVPSDARAILKTVETRLESRGAFDIPATQEGTREVSVIQGDEGSREVWNVYREVSKAAVEKLKQYKELEEGYSEIVLKIEKKKKDIEKVSSGIDVFFEAKEMAEESEKVKMTP